MFFKGLGIEIPVYLRCEGRPKNRNLTRQELSNIIEEILKERATQKESVIF
jgi:hypothetical protein